LISTNRRCKFIEIGLDDLYKISKGEEQMLSYKSSFDGQTKSFVFSTNPKEFFFLKQSGANCFIQNPQIQHLCKRITVLKNSMKDIISVVYQKFVAAFEEYKPFLETVIQFVTLFDVAYTKAYLASKYHYCKPQLIESDKSFVQCQGLRHILVENLNIDEIYVTNDILLGKGETDGLLLYGTNAVGKTCFIKALGICVIMAQAGLYVPCTEFIYQPYTYLFTRILGNDNLFKGLSTFAVEMSELRTILRLADRNSLVLGDELCSGTENISAISIFMSGIMRLYEKGSSFIFATHLHEIVHYEEIRAMHRLALKHMEVVFDKEKQCLVYDRKLKEGPGSSLYGLEVCKSLSLPEEFLDLAFQIRVKYYPESGGPLSLQTSHYNAKKIVGGLCERCGIEKSVEVHHLLHQSQANNEDGYIVDREKGITVHKNHLANLMSLCEKCHKAEHHSRGLPPPTTPCCPSGRNSFK
jgi:DNA mismatch repair protein MutS